MKELSYRSKLPVSQGSNQSSTLEEMSLVEHIVAYISLGLLCGCVHLYFFAFPVLFYFIYRGSLVAIAIATAFVISALHPLGTKPWAAFTDSWLFKIWHKYFAYSWICYAKLEKGKKYIFLEFPHAIFPMVCIC